MPHAVHTRDLGRNRSWRAATVRSLALALLRSQKIKTTRAKAKEAQRLTERLISLGKKGTLAARRQALSVLSDEGVVWLLFAEIAPRFKSRSGGYTRIVQDGFRAGDGAELAWIELTEKGLEEKPKAKEKEGPRLKVAPKEKPPEKRRPGLRIRAPSAGVPEGHPEVQPPVEKPRGERPKPSEKKPRGFIEGLRKFFKRRHNP